MPRIEHDLGGFLQLTRLYEATRDCSLEDIEIDMARTNWLAADMCAPLGAILYALGNRGNAVCLSNLGVDVEDILSRNSFLSHYGRDEIPDVWQTTIPYRRFDVEDSRSFAAYTDKDLLNRPEMPGMSREFEKKFRESILEIFSNSVLHSKTKGGIFSCGQFFPKQEQLFFSVADLGVGIRRNVEDFTGRRFSSTDAIKWATEGANTTKPRHEGVPGGLGLKLLGRFVGLNGGCIRIVSEDGYWEKRGDAELVRKLAHPFPGTVVSVEVNTADTGSYKLVSEASLDDIF